MERKIRQIEYKDVTYKVGTDPFLDGRKLYKIERATLVINGVGKSYIVGLGIDNEVIFLFKRERKILKINGYVKYKGGKND